MDYQSSPREYVLAGISIDGVVHLDHEMIIQKSELVRGERLMIPSEKISKAISNLWEQDLFSSVEIIKEKNIKQTTKQVRYKGENLKLKVPYIDLNGNDVWGATGAILNELKMILSST